MKKIINQNSDVVEEMLQGYLAAYSRYFERIGDYDALKYKERRRKKVSLVVGGGSGHEPLFLGFVGRGLADAVACGNIFASPNPNLILETAKAVDEGQGVLFVYGNYAGDNLNFDMAEELCEIEGIKTANVRVYDDTASAPRERVKDRRGIAGDIFVIKIAGAACDAGLSLEEVHRITSKARDQINSIGLATSPGTIPGMNSPTFELGEDEIEFGMGLHGEPGIERTSMQPANQLVERMYGILAKDMNLQSGERIAVLVNGLGSTTLFELSTVYYELDKHIKKDNLVVHDVELKSYCTCQEMGGFSITILKLDDELLPFYNARFESPYYSRRELQ